MLPVTPDRSQKTIRSAWVFWSSIGVGINYRDRQEDPSCGWDL